MLQAVLANPNHPQYGVATIPFPVKNSDYESTMDLLEPLEIGDAVKQDCRIEEIRSELSALKRLERSNANLDEIDYLAKRLDSFDEYEKAQFQGMASRLDLHGIDEFINLSFCCQEATVATDFRGLESLGRRHYLTMNGGSAAVEEMKNKDFREIALALLEGAVGRVTPYGVVYDNDFEMAQLYDGRNFPQYRYEDCLMEVEMSSRYAPPDSPAAYLYLPVSQTQIERTMFGFGTRFSAYRASSCSHITTTDSSVSCTTRPEFKSSPPPASTISSRGTIPTASLPSCSSAITTLPNGPVANRVR